MKHFFQSTAGYVAIALTLLLGAALTAFPQAVTQIAGLAVATATTPGAAWNNVQDGAVVGNGLTKGVLAVTNYGKNAAGTFDAPALQSDNSVNPSTGKQSVLPCVASSGTAVMTSGNVNPLHCTINGDLTTTSLQMGTLGNSTQTSAANTINTIANAAVAGSRWNIDFLEVFASAAAVCTLTIQDGGTIIYSHPLTTQSSAAPLQVSFGNDGITNTVGNAMQVSIGACGGVVTSTINQVASRG